MAKTFNEMKTNVGNMVMDTTAAFATLIGRWLNDKYHDVWQKYHFSDVINNNYTLTLISGTAEYNLPSDFEVEMAVSDTTDGFKLGRMNERMWWENRTEAYSGGTITQGTATRYVILQERIKSDGSGFGKIAFDPTPNNTHTIAMPYKRKCEDLISVTGTCTTDTANKVIASASTFITSGVKPGMRIKNTTDTTYSIVTSVDSETQLTVETDVCPDGNETFEIFTSPVIRDIEYILECGAISEAWLYKRQYQKASDFLQKYEYELKKRIGRENTQPNQRYQWIPERGGPSAIEPFTGWASYDTI